MCRARGWVAPTAPVTPFSRGVWCGLCVAYFGCCLRGVVYWPERCGHRARFFCTWFQIDRYITRIMRHEVRTTRPDSAIRTIRLKTPDPSSGRLGCQGSIESKRHFHMGLGSCSTPLESPACAGCSRPVYPGVTRRVCEIDTRGQREAGFQEAPLPSFPLEILENAPLQRPLARSAEALQAS